MWVSVLLFMISLGKEAGLFGAICLLLFLSRVCQPGWVGSSRAGRCPPGRVRASGGSPTVASARPRDHCTPLLPL